MSWQVTDSFSQFRTQITLFLPGNPETSRVYENIREYTLGSERRIHFIAEDGKSISTNLPFILEREPRKPGMTATPSIVGDSETARPDTTL